MRQSAHRSPEASELRELANAEIEELDKMIVDIEQNLKVELTPKDEADERGVVLEVRAGTGKIVFERPPHLNDSWN